MASIVLKDVPEGLHQRLKEQAARNRRSMTQEALQILERALRPLPPLEPIQPIKPRKSFTQRWLRRAIEERRR